MEATQGTNAESDQRKADSFWVLTVSVLFLSGWIWGLNWLFTHFTGHSYFQWYLQNGALIGVATAFLALVWQGLEVRTDLLSSHPLRFLRSCAGIAAIFYMVVAANLGGPLDGLSRRAEGAVSIFETLWDAACAVIINLMMGLAVLAWIVIISPLYYVLTLVTGAPARRELRNTGIRVVVRKEGSHTIIAEQRSTDPVQEGAMDVSFGARPFALTNALNAAVLWVANVLLLP